MTETIIRLIEGKDITGKDPNTGKLVGGDVVIFQKGELASGLNSIAFRRGCGMTPIPSTCKLFEDGKCSATNIVSKEEEGVVGPYGVHCGEGMDRAGILTRAAEVFTDFREEVEKQLFDMLKNTY